MSEPQRFTAFYSWQSDLPDASNRAFIRQALRAAATATENSGSNIIVEIDEATRDVAGSPNIPVTILAKIAAADMFVCDVTTINTDGPGRKTPNPNVVFELGYAVANLGWERIVLLFNTEVGDFPADLPFDFDRHRASPFNAKETPSSKQKKQLSTLIESAIGAVVVNSPVKPNNTLSPEQKKRLRDIENLRWILSTLHLPTLDQHVLDSPHILTDKVLYFWEGFNGVISSSLFHLYDKKLAVLWTEYHAAFRETVQHGECYHPNVNSSAYIFTNKGDMPLTQEKEEIWDAIRDAGDQMHRLMQEILAEVRESYLEISIDETNREAWREYVQFKKEAAEALDSDT